MSYDIVRQLYRFKSILQNRNLEKAKEFITENAANLNVQNENGFTFLMLTTDLINYHYDKEAKKTIREITKLLIDNGADPNIQDIYGETALVIAIEFGDIETVDLLIEKGAKVNLANNYGSSPLLYSIMSDNRHHKALEITELLIKKGADLNAKNDEGNYALMHCVQTHRTELLKLLIKYGADLNMKDNDGDTVLTWITKAASWGGMNFHKYYTHEYMNLLTRGGADLNIADKDGNTPFWLSVKNWDFKLFLALTWQSVNQHLFNFEKQSYIGANISLKEGDQVDLYTDSNADSVQESEHQEAGALAGVIEN